MIRGLAPVGAQIRLRVECERLSVADTAAILRAFAAVARGAYREEMRRHRVRGRSRADVVVASLTVGSPLDLVTDLALPPYATSALGDLPGHAHQWLVLVADVLRLLGAMVGRRTSSEKPGALDGGRLTVLHPDGPAIEAPVTVLQDDRMTSNLIRLAEAIGRVDGAGTLGAAADPRFPPMRPE